jgi:folate-dependent phosphoribosylglycinamide formyltransferase PurN
MARLVLLTRDDLEHRYVANRLCATLDIERIFVDRQPVRVNIRRAWTQGAGHFISKAARRFFLYAIRDDQMRKRVLGKMLEESDSFSTPQKIRVVEGINSPEVVSLVQEINPTVILVYGTSVIKDRVLNLAQDICFNMHTGISPYFRGTACTLWPIVTGELHMLGSTIHECTSRVDGGKTFEVVHVTCVPGDNLHAVFARTVIAGADAYSRVVRGYLAGEVRGVPQDLSVGREYSGSQLTLGPEVKARFRLWKMAQLQNQPFARCTRPGSGILKARNLGSDETSATRPRFGKKGRNRAA